jgi:hypothetical protein
LPPSVVGSGGGAAPISLAEKIREEARKKMNEQIAVIQQHKSEHSNQLFKDARVVSCK